MADVPGWEGRLFEDFTVGTSTSTDSAGPSCRPTTRGSPCSRGTRRRSTTTPTTARLPAPVFEGDTIYSEPEVPEARESRSRADAGIVRVRTTGSNQDGVVVITFVRTLMVYRRGHGPAAGRPRPRG